MGDVTYVELGGFNPNLWTSQADGWKENARKAAHQAESMRRQAEEMAGAASGPAGQAASERMRERARFLETAARGYDQVGTTLARGADQMEQHQRSMATLVDELARGNVDVDGDGNMTPRATNNPFEMINRTKLASTGEQLRDQILQRAGELDDLIAKALRARRHLPPLEHSDTGPADLSIEGIEAAGKTNAQGQWGNCTQLATLRALASVDPEVLQRNVRWDPEQGVYWVQLYDPRTGAPLEPVAVDPSQIVDASDNSYDPDKVDIFDIYEQALMTTDPTHHGDPMEYGMRRITGEDPTTIEHGPDFSPEQVEDQLEGDPPRAVTVETSGRQPDDVPDEKRLVDGHAYEVVEVKENGNIVVRNPWGPMGGVYGEPPKYCPGQVELTPEEYQQWLMNTTVQGE